MGVFGGSYSAEHSGREIFSVSATLEKVSFISGSGWTAWGLIAGS